MNILHAAVVRTLHQYVNAWPGRPGQICFETPSRPIGVPYLHIGAGRYDSGGSLHTPFTLTLRTAADSAAAVEEAYRLFDSFEGYRRETPLTGRERAALCAQEETPPAAPRAGILLTAAPECTRAYSDGTRAFTARYELVCAPSDAADSSDSSDLSDASDASDASGEAGTDGLRVRIEMGMQSLTAAGAGRGSADFVLREAEGLESPPYTVGMTQRAAADGASVTGHSLAPRRIALALAFRGSRETAAAKQEYLMRFFGPGGQGRLEAERFGRRRAIGFLVRDAAFVSDGKGAFTCRCVLACPDPLFEDVSPAVLSMQTRIPLLAFPFNSAVHTGVTTGISRQEYTVSLVNAGHTGAGFTAVITCAGAEAKNPCLSCGMARIRIVDTLVHGDVYRISTIPGSLSVTKNGKTSLLFDADSTFFLIPPGRTALSLSADENCSALTAEISYLPRYFGV